MSSVTEPSSDRAETTINFPEAFATSGASWPVSEPAAVAELHFQGVLDAIGGLELSVVPSVAVREAALAFAIIDERGAVRAADPAFPFSSGDLPPALKRLFRQARRGEAAIGLVETPGGALIAVCAASSSAASAWPLTDVTRGALAMSKGQLAAMAFKPLRQADIGRRAASAFGLSELESRVVAALLEAPTLEIAASRIGVGRETARGALNGAMRKVGVKRTADLVRRLINLMCGASADEDDNVLGEALALTPAQARVAGLTAGGASIGDVAETLGVTPETVKSHMKSVYGKTGIARAKDLGRVDVEVRTLKMLSRAREVVTWGAETDGRLRVIAGPSGRHVAFMDYGRAAGRPLFVCHALASGRTLPPGLADRLRAVGFRPVLPQRPGFGLTDPHTDDYLDAAADDMAIIADALKASTIEVFARDIATAAVLAFAGRHPDRLGRALLLNPEGPQRQDTRPYAINVAARMLQRHPEATATFFEVLRRQTRTDRLAAMVLESFRNGAPSDVAAVRAPETLSWLVRDMQAMVALTATGVVSERLVYGDWRPPDGLDGAGWTIAICRELGDVRPGAWWERMPGARVETIDSGGLLMAVSHPDTLLDLLTKGASR